MRPRRRSAAAVDDGRATVPRDDHWHRPPLGLNRPRAFPLTLYASTFSSPALFFWFARLSGSRLPFWRSVWRRAVTMAWARAYLRMRWARVYILADAVVALHHKSAATSTVTPVGLSKYASVPVQTSQTTSHPLIPSRFRSTKKKSSVHTAGIEPARFRNST